MNNLELFKKQRKNALIDKQPSTGHIHIDSAISDLLEAGFDDGFETAMERVKPLVQALEEFASEDYVTRESVFQSGHRKFLQIMMRETLNSWRSGDE